MIACVHVHASAFVFVCVCVSAVSKYICSLTDLSQPFDVGVCCLLLRL